METPLRQKSFWVLHGLVAAMTIASMTSPIFGSPGTEGAAFLEIPMGAGPAALGSAYTALATNAYAPTWNPAGLGFIDATGVAAQHLSYLSDIHDEYLSFVNPLPEGKNSSVHRGIGVSAQYLGTGDITRTDIDSTGNYVLPGGSFSSHYGAYNISYGQTLGEKTSVGVTGKLINAQIDDVSANAYAADFGALYKLNTKLDLAATATNIGTRLKFLDQGDPLPMEFHAAAAYKPDAHYLLTTEEVYARATGLASFHVGGQWQPTESMSLRVGYRTDTLKGLDALAGFSTGIGVDVWGQEFAYAWIPYGDLGDTQYFSLLLRFGGREEEKRNLIQYQTIKQHRLVGTSKPDTGEPEYQQLMQLLSDTDTRVAQAQPMNDLGN